MAHLDSTIDNQLFIKGVPHLTEHSLYGNDALQEIVMEDNPTDEGNE